MTDAAQSSLLPQSGTTSYFGCAQYKSVTIVDIAGILPHLQIFSRVITFIYRSNKKEYLLLSAAKLNFKVSSQTHTELTKQVQHEYEQKNIVK
ncbi:hypothetical protein [Nostoc flagelliforme]|uniref:hypothetical protein n=1 Tax=Nostoc flagelliforme TaxID=1306274 RepID=UPI001687C076|nr:hypothetical protein [Nostoc flagelliforme]